MRRVSTAVAALAALAVLVTLSSCKRLTDPICSIDTAWALEISLADSLTGQTGPFHTLSLVAVDGGWRDSMYVGTVGPNPDQNLYRLARERPGNYAVTVRADGYRPWIKSGILVEGDECHVFPATVRVRLAPL
jgi:hypothetical protein